jgi:hypothetical protein
MKHIKEVMEGHFNSQVEKHRMNVNILLENPRAIPEHTDFSEAVEKELEQMAHYKDLLAALNDV